MGSSISGMKLVPVTWSKVTGLEFSAGVYSRKPWIFAMFHLAVTMFHLAVKRSGPADAP